TVAGGAPRGRGVAGEDGAGRAGRRRAAHAAGAGGAGADRHAGGACRAEEACRRRGGVVADARGEGVAGAAEVSGGGGTAGATADARHTMTPMPKTEGVLAVFRAILAAVFVGPLFV